MVHETIMDSLDEWGRQAADWCAGDLPYQVSRAEAAPAMLDVVEALRGNRSAFLFLHHAGNEFLLAEAKCLPGLRDRLAQKPYRRKA